MGNIHVKLSEIWTSGSGGDFFKKKLMEDGHMTDEDQSQYLTLSLRLR